MDSNFFVERNIAINDIKQISSDSVLNYWSWID